jgi:predicted transcriptional regulator
MSSAAEIAKKMGLTEQQVAEVIASLGESRGEWKTTVNSIVTHADGRRHWSSQQCEECAR